MPSTSGDITPAPWSAAVTVEQSVSGAKKTKKPKAKARKAKASA